MFGKRKAVDVSKIERDADDKLRHITQMQISIVQQLGDWPEQLRQIVSYAETAIQAGQLDRAKAWLDTAQRHITDSASKLKHWQAELHVLNGYYFSQKGDKANARVEIDKAVLLEPNNERIKQTITRLNVLMEAK